MSISFQCCWGSILPSSGPVVYSCWIPTVLLCPTDYKPQSSPGMLPDLPAYILFLCFRHADHCCDEPRARSLLAAATDAIKRVMKVLSLGVWVGLRSRSFTGQGGDGPELAAWPPRAQHLPDCSVQPEHLLGWGMSLGAAGLLQEGPTALHPHSLHQAAALCGSWSSCGV